MTLKDAEMHVQWDIIILFHQKCTFFTGIYFSLSVLKLLAKLSVLIHFIFFPKGAHHHLKLLIHLKPFDLLSLKYTKIQSIQPRILV